MPDASLSFDVTLRGGLRHNEDLRRTHHRAKQVLEVAKTKAARRQAIVVAMELGMPLHEIELHLDWLDARS